MPYRQMQRATSPNFTFTEKLFVSGKRTHAALGHLILISKPILQILAIGLAIILGGAAFLGLAGLLVYGAHMLLTASIRKGYLSDASATVLVVICGGVAIVLPAVYKFCVASIKANREIMRSRIRHKLNNKVDK